MKTYNRKCRLLKKALAVTLSACLVLTMAVPTFAATKTYPSTGDTTINYLVIGDSMSNGYCLDGYTGEKAGWNNVPAGIYGEVFAEYLKGKGYTVNLSQYAMASMRSQDLRYILDPTYERDTYGNNISINTLNAVKDDYVQAVKDADIISMALAMNDLGTFVAFRFKEMVFPGGSDAYKDIQIENLIRQENAEEFNKYKTLILDYLKSALGSDYEEIVDSAVEPLVDAMVYGLLSFMKNFSEDMDLLRQNNPDATIIAYGTMNSLEGKKMKFDVDGRQVVLDLGKLYGIILGLADTYMQADIATSGDENSFYVPVPAFEILVSELGRLDKNKVNFESPMEEGLLDSVVEIFGGAINDIAAGAFNKDGIRQAVTAYISGWLDPAGATSQAEIEQIAGAKMLAQIYLGIRDAVIDVAPMNTMNGSDLIGALSKVDETLGNVAYDITEGKSAEELAKMVLEDTEETFRANVTKALEKDGIKDALFIFDLCIASNGMGAHPSLAGHNAMGKRLIDSYETFLTAGRLSGTVTDTVSSITGNLIDSFYGILKKISGSDGENPQEGNDSSLISSLTKTVSSIISNPGEGGTLIIGSLGSTAKVFSELAEKYIQAAAEAAEKDKETELPEFTLTFNTNGGSVISPITDVQDKSIDLSAYVPTKEGYVFEGWYSDSGLTQRVVAAILTEDMTVYAKWTEAGADDPQDDPQDDPVDPYVNPFVDVSAGDYFYEPVLWAVENGITTGTSARTFSPESPCTRGQAVTFLWRAAGQPEPRVVSVRFADVTNQDYYAKAVAWAVEEGITTGTSATTFSPDAECTRAQIVTFLHRAKGSPAAYKTLPFTDVSPDDYFYNAVAWAVEEGITTGTSRTTFSPYASCTRGQIVTFLYRAK